MATFSSRHGRSSNDLYLPERNVARGVGEWEEKKRHSEREREKERGCRRLISVSLSPVVRANRARLFSGLLKRVIS